jgi:hypothetical protein
MFQIPRRSRTLVRLFNRLALRIALLALPAAADVPPVAPDAQTWLLTFPEPGVCPEFDLVSLQLLQTTAPSLPALADLAGKPGTRPVLGIMTAVVAGPADDLVAYLEAHPGLQALLYDLTTGDNLAMADCRLIHPVAAAQGRPPLRVLQFTYADLAITQELP